MAASAYGTSEARRIGWNKQGTFFGRVRRDCCRGDSVTVTVKRWSRIRDGVSGPIRTEWDSQRRERDTDRYGHRVRDWN